MLGELLALHPEDVEGDHAAPVGEFVGLMQGHHVPVGQRSVRLYFHGRQRLEGVQQPLPTVRDERRVLDVVGPDVGLDGRGVVCTEGLEDGAHDLFGALGRRGVRFVCAAGGRPGQGDAEGGDDGVVLDAQHDRISCASRDAR